MNIFFSEKKNGKILHRKLIFTYNIKFVLDYNHNCEALRFLPNLIKHNSSGRPRDLSSQQADLQ